MPLTTSISEYIVRRIDHKNSLLPLILDSFVSYYYLFLLPLLITSSQNCLFNTHATYYTHYSTKRHNSGMDSYRTKVLHRFASDFGNRKHFTHFTGDQTLQTPSQNTERQHQPFRVHTTLVRAVLQQRTRPPFLQVPTTIDSFFFG